MDQGDYIDYLKSLEPRGVPQHKLALKINTPVILLRNINPVEGICNSTWLICKQLTPNLVGAIIATGVSYKSFQLTIDHIYIVIWLIAA
ncbi:unnamed protein product [Lathyrus sativus]|nr:unnamed protein product [Lathyrus sativus]